MSQRTFILNDSVCSMNPSLISDTNVTLSNYDVLSRYDEIAPVKIKERLFIGPYFAHIL